MALIKRYKPTTPGIRGTVVPLYKKLLTQGNKPLKILTKGTKKTAGRASGRISSRWKGGGHKKLFREVDFIYDKKDIPAKIQTVEYDPNRSAFISLICFNDGEKRYILAPKGINVGDEIIVAEKAKTQIGNRAKLRNIPVGTQVHNVEIKENGGAKIARSAGSSVEVLGSDGKYVHLKMASKEVRKVSANGYATIGTVSNDVHRLKVLGKAGRSRWMGRRPSVRGSAMNPVDHPHGGGEGKAGRGRKRAVTKWGKPSGKGQKTRKKNKYSNSFIVRTSRQSKKK